MHEEAAVLRFFHAYVADHARGATRSVDDYVAEFPEHGDRIRVEFLRISGQLATTGARWIGGRYLVLESLGRGGFGEVFLAQDSSMDRRVAVKVLDDYRALSARWRQRLVREAEAVHRIDSDGCCPVYDVGFDEGVPFLVMPWIPGRALSGIYAAARARGESPARASAGLSPSTALPALLGLVADVARTLAAAHRSGVIHRDVKPANVLVRPDGKPIVIDFGLAWLDSAEGGPSTLRSGAFGTPAYAAPEVLAATPGPPDARSDIWSLGAVLFEGLTGERPFPARGRRPGVEAERPLIRLEARYGDDVQAVVEAALARRPADRYPDMEAFAADLERLCRRQSVSVRPAGRARRAAEWARRRPALLGAYALCAALVTAVLTWFVHAREQAIIERGVSALAATVDDLAADLKLRGQLGMPLKNQLEDATATLRLARGLRAGFGVHEELDRSLSRILVSVAEVELASGSYTAARAHLEEASALMAASVALGLPPEAADRRCRSHALVLAGDVLTREGRYEDALAEFRRALAIDEALRAEQPADARSASDCGFGYLRIGVWEQQLGNFSQARALSEKAVAELRRAEQLAPDEPARRAHVAEALVARAASLMASGGGPDDVAALHQEAIARQLEWADAHRDDAMSWLTLANTVRQAAAAGDAGSSLDGMLERCARELLRLEPDAPMFATKAAVLQLLRAQLAAAAGDVQAGRRLLEQARGTMEHARRSGSLAAYMMRSWVGFLLGSAAIREALGEHGDAAGLFEQAFHAAREHYEQGAKRGPETLFYLGILEGLQLPAARAEARRVVATARSAVATHSEAFEQLAARVAARSR